MKKFLNIIDKKSDKHIDKLPNIIVKCVPIFLSTAPPKKQKIYTLIDCKIIKKYKTAEFTIFTWY